MQSVTPLEQTFLDLAAIDEVYPHEVAVLDYVKARLTTAKVSYHQDAAGNLVAQLGEGANPLAVVGHVDIAASLGGRQIIMTPEVIKTDGTGLLGADDKAAVAIMLELASTSAGTPLAQPLELVFTVGEEAGCVGAKALDMSLVKSRQALVLDWLGGVQNVVTSSPAYVKIDATYTGRDAHPAHWRDGINAGAALAQAVAGVEQGEYLPGVICNVGIMYFGNARNKVPGLASLQAEIRSFDAAKIDVAITKLRSHFTSVAAKANVAATVTITKDSPSYAYQPDGELFGRVTQGLKSVKLVPNLETTYGCFDGNILAARGLEVLMLGAGYYNPHSPSEYLDRHQFAQAYAVVQALAEKLV